jgi:ketol-acid reductoisomerase
MKFIYESDVGPSPLKGKCVSVVGFGNQGRAHAENLRDSGVTVLVALRPGSSSRQSAIQAGFAVHAIDEATRLADITAFLIPDEAQGELYRQSVAPAMGEGKTLLFAHGFSIHFGEITPPAGVDVVMTAPKGPGYQVRREYVEGRGVVMLTAVHQDASGRARETSLEYAAAIGGGRAGIFESSFREECETDLFGEQAVICGGLSHLVTAGFETLVEAGYSPEMAYFECLHEVKLVADLIHHRGIAGMREAISNTARFGDLTRGPRIIGPAVKDEMRKVLREVQSGLFARQWMEENRSGRPLFEELSEKGAAHPVEEVGSRMREAIPSLRRGKA